MREVDPFNPERWETTGGMARRAATMKQSARERKPGRFLKGPVPWSWLIAAMAIPGKALAVGLLLWKEAGCERKRTVYFSLARAVMEGIPKATAHRAMRSLEAAGLVEVKRKPGRGWK